MKILANKKIKELFGKITVCTVIFILAAVLLTSFEAESVTLVIILCMGGKENRTAGITDLSHHPFCVLFWGQNLLNRTQ